MRTIFKTLFRKDIKAHEDLAHEKEKQGQKLKPLNETDAIADVIKRVNEIAAEIKLEKKQK